jgi:hypothetical protein
MASCGYEIPHGLILTSPGLVLLAIWDSPLDPIRDGKPTLSEGAVTPSSLVGRLLPAM